MRIALGCACAALLIGAPISQSSAARRSVRQSGNELANARQAYLDAVSYSGNKAGAPNIRATLDAYLAAYNAEEAQIQQELGGLSVRLKNGEKGRELNARAAALRAQFEALPGAHPELQYWLSLSRTVSGGPVEEVDTKDEEGLPACNFAENFDGVVIPALPPGWSSVVATGLAANVWRTVNNFPSSPPNSVRGPDPATVHDIRLNSPALRVTSNAAQLTFRNAADLENGFDGGVLEISINGGAFQDIIAAGGTFVTGGYNVTLSSSFMNPLGGRQAWSNLPNYITSTVNLPAAANGQTIILRWRLGTDNSVADFGWDVDSITITNACIIAGCTFFDNFDDDAAGAPPAGWTTANIGPGISWLTQPANVLPGPSFPPFSAPHSVFVPHNQVVPTDKRLDSPPLFINSATAQLNFRLRFNTEDTFDGMVLEISIGGGAFQDILVAGGSFVQFGYTDVISAAFGSPIAGRMAWSGDSALIAGNIAGYINPIVNLPASALGQTVVFRFRAAQDFINTGVGISIDDVGLSGGCLRCNLTCPANIVAPAPAGTCSAVVNFALPTGAGACGTITCSPASGSTFPLGTTTVTCTSTIGGGQCSFTVRVTDVTAPTITCPVSPLIVGTSPNLCTGVANFTPTTSDNCPGAITVVCVPPSGSIFPRGSTIVNCTASDTATPPNVSMCSFTVFVADTQNPTVGPCPAPIVVPQSQPNGAIVTFPTPGVTDNCPGVGPVTCVPASGSVFPATGLPITVTCSATDVANGPNDPANTGSCTFTVTVQPATFNFCVRDDITGDTFRAAVGPGGFALGYYEYKRELGAFDVVYFGTAAPGNINTTSIGVTIIDANALLSNVRASRSFNRFTGQAIVTVAATGQTFRITDSDTRNSVCP